jgi:prophage antirepressor-like protein
MAVISESGIYSAALRSRVPGAKAFKRWVTESLPLEGVA